MNSFPFSSSALKPHFLPLTNTNEEHDQGHTGAPTPPFSGETSPQNHPLPPFCSGHTCDCLSLCSGYCHCSSASPTRQQGYIELEQVLHE
ncbi:hypothetical protein C1H46_000472 [Malus baccata]|uniref:Uncharacterized protein n=1 Tax=Malus baccata TaxID=106549 RepID=A0A540NS35_MALBA|nr:hypothetical protein C1H46_000472 [Malus baccata]